MSRSGWRAIQVVIVCSSVLICVSVVALPWRGVGQGDPFHLGTKLYQMGLPVITASLVVVAVVAVGVGLAMRPGNWSSIVMFLLGAGTIVLGLLVQSSSASSAFIVGTKHLHAGLVVAVLAGLLLIGAGAADAISSRSTDQ